MLILNETNYSNGKVTLYDNENNVVSNGHVEVYVGTNKVSTFSLDAYGQGTPSITAGIFYRFEVFDSVGELVSILEPVSLGESSSGGVTPAALEAETAARIAADDSLQGQINSKAYKSYVDDKLGQIAYDKRVIEAKINEEVTRAKDAEKANSDTIEEASNSIESHVSDKSNPHEVTAEQVGAYTKAHVDEKIKAITDLIPTAATPANQLADKAYVDFGVEQMAAKYLSATADGQPFSSYAQFQQGVFYYGGEVTEPTKNDYALVNGDETHDNAVTRYVFTTEWNFQYVVNNSPLNAEQLAALNSGINATKVGNYDSHIADTTKHITEAERTKWNAAVQPSQLATVATTGSYSDLTGKPTIPPAITVDSAMSSTSTNPVQNKAVYWALNGKLNHITDASKITGTIQSFTSWEISIVYRSGFNGSFVRLWDVTSFKDGSIVNLNNDQVNFKGFFIAGKNQGMGSPEVVEIACKVAYNQTTHYLKSSSKDCGPCICSREEDGVKRYYLGIYYPATLFSSQGASLCGFFSSYASDESFSHSNFLGDYTPWQTWPSQESLWTKEFSWTGSVDANKLFSARQILVNLGSGSGAGFDGSANVNPGVYGTLPIANGGTGASTAAAARTNLGLGSLATKSSVTDSDISGTIADSHIASASAWNGKQDALSFTTADEITEILGGLE